MSSSRVGPVRRDVGEASTLLQQPLPSNALPTTSARRTRTPGGAAPSRPAAGSGASVGGLNVTPGRATPVARAATPGEAAQRAAALPTPSSRRVPHTRPQQQPPSRSPSAHSTATTTAPTRRGASASNRGLSAVAAAAPIEDRTHPAGLPLAAADPIPLAPAAWEADPAWMRARAALLGLGDCPTWSTDESLAAAEMTVAGETHLARLAAGRIARQDLALQLLRDERIALERRVAAAKETAAGAETAKSQLARAVRSVEAEALQARVELRHLTNAQAQLERSGLAPAGSAATTPAAGQSPVDAFGLHPIGRGSGAAPAPPPHTIIRSMLKHQDPSFFERRILSLDASADGNAASGLVPPSPLARGFSAATDATSAIGAVDAPGPGRQRPLSIIERLQRTDEMRKELEASVRATRFAVESRAAELEAVLGELDTLQVQVPGSSSGSRGAFEHESSDGYRAAIHDAREQLRLYAWLKASLPLVQDSVETRISMSAQTRRYTKRLVDELAAANHAADDAARRLRADMGALTPGMRADRPALIGAVTQAVQAENQQLQASVRDTIEDSDAWRRDMSERAMSLKAQLLDLDRKLEATRGQRSKAMI